MRLYLMRHGVAEDVGPDGDDDSRRLTAKGAAAAEAVAAALVRGGAAPEVIVTSTLARAEQTARIVAEALGVPVVLDDRLAGPCRTSDLPELLAPASEGAEAMLVGHEPTMSVLLHGLTGARAVFKKGACARVDLAGPAETGTLVWLVTPGLVR